MNLKRMLRHLVTTIGSVNTAFPPRTLDAIERAIAQTEARHNGQIRFAVEHALDLPQLHAAMSARERAIEMFGLLRVWDTEHNNGVLIYLLLAEHAIEVVADRGLARQVPQEHWRQIVQRMGGAFRAGRYEEGLTQAIDEVTAVLVQHFPLAEGKPNPNELPDQPVLG